jgi:DNA-directed RNA polymerase subunit M/transcription elongation factor TFIIS
MSKKRPRSKVESPVGNEPLEESVQKTVSGTLKLLKPGNRHQYRKKAKKLLEDAFAKSTPKHSSDWKTRSKEFAATVESQLYFTYFVFDEPTYGDKIRMLCRHVPPIIDIVSKLDPVFVAGMSPAELTMAEDVPFVAEQKIQEDIYGTKSEVLCRKCGSSTSYESKQLRGADEPATIF